MHNTGDTPRREGAAFDAALAEARAEAKPGTYERLTGAQVAALPADQRDGWEWDEDYDDEVGHYERRTPAVAAIRWVAFGRSDIAETIH